MKMILCGLTDAKLSEFYWLESVLPSTGFALVFFLLVFSLLFCYFCVHNSLIPNIQYCICPQVR